MAKNMTQVPTYDLTTPSGLEKALTDYAKQNPVKGGAILGLLAVIYPLPVALIAAKAVSNAFSGVVKDSEKVIEAQRKAAVDIIKSGKENGVKKMKVTLDQNAGVDIGGQLEGYALKFAFGSDSKMTIDVEY